MIVTEFLLALVFSLLLVSVLSLVFGRAGPWAASGSAAGLVWFFLVVFLGAWAIGTWVTPVGPIAWGVAWLPFLFGALAIALLLAGLSEPTTPRTAVEAEAGVEATLGAFIWVLLIVLAVTIAAGVL